MALPDYVNMKSILNKLQPLNRLQVLDDVLELLLKKDLGLAIVIRVDQMAVFVKCVRDDFVLVGRNLRLKYGFVCIILSS